CGSARARADPGELRAARAHPGAAGPHAHAETVGARSRPACPAHPESPGRRQPQGRRGPVQHPRQERPRDARRAHRGRDRSRAPGRPCAGHRPPEARRAGGGAPRARHAHHRTLLTLHLHLVDPRQAALTELEAAVGKALAPIRQQTRLLMTMPGVSDPVAHVLVAEIGIDMTRFPTAAHLVSWAGLCPRTDESAGKRRSTRVRLGAPWLKPTLVMAAWAAVRTKNSYLQAQFLRLKARRGAKKAILAVAASMLGACYYMLRDGVSYRDLGADHFARRDRAKTIGRLVRRLRDLGCE